MDEKKEWDRYWQTASEKKSFLGDVFTAYRKQILARGLSHYVEKYFPKKGIFVEAGSGSSQTSVRLKKHKRKFIAVDISSEALSEAKKNPLISKTIRADIRKLPFPDSSIDGIWNLGVMEHFSKDDIQKILLEFRRVLKKDGVLLLFWPPRYAPYHYFFRFIHFLGRLMGKEWQFFPDEPSQLKSKKEAEIILRNAGFSAKIHFSFRDGFTYLVVVSEKI